MNPVHGPATASSVVAGLRRAAVLGAALGLFATAGCSGDSPGAGEDGGSVARGAPDRADYTVHADVAYSADLGAAHAYVPEDKRASLETLIDTPVAVWLSTDDSAAAVRDVLDRSAADRTVPVFVAYNIPQRDDGGHSVGGGESAIGYVHWIQGISDSIGQQDAVVVVEPDALSHVPELDDAAASERVSMLAAALKVLATNTNTAVYLDAGNSAWRSPQDTADLLERVAAQDVEVPGIAVNVANYRPAAEAERYGLDVQESYGTDLFVLIDNSRNGSGVTDDVWCNPPSQRMGTISDRVFDPEARLEEVFVKLPGESDGRCGISDKPAGEFDGNLLSAQLP